MKPRRSLESVLIAAVIFVGVLSPVCAQPAAPATPAPPPPPSARMASPAALPPASTTPPPAPASKVPAPARPAEPLPYPMMPVMQPPSAEALDTPGPEANVPGRVAVLGVAALVNGQPITNSDLALEFLKEGGQPILQEMIDRKVVFEAAAKQHIKLTSAEVDASLRDFKNEQLTQEWRYTPGVTWAQFLTMIGRSEYFVREYVKTKLLLEKLVVKTMPPVTLKGKMHLYHILLMVGPTSPKSRTDDQARAQLEQIRTDILAGKTTFQDAARKYSEDTVSGQNGGDLGWMTIGDTRVDPDFMKGAEALKEGETSQPIKSRFGEHLIFLARTGNHATQADIRAETAKELPSLVGPQQLQSFMAQLRASAKVQELLMPGVPLPKPSAPAPVVAPRPRASAPSPEK